MKNLHFNFSFILAIVASSFMLPSSNNLALPVDNTTAAVDYFLKIEGIKGESKDDKHYEWIDVLSVRVDKARKTVFISRKTTAVSSPLIRRFCAERTLLKKVLIDDTDGTSYKLKDVIITSYQTSGSGDQQMETATITYTGLE